MKTLPTVLILTALSIELSVGQIAGNAVYGQEGARARAEASEQAKRIVSPYDVPPDGSMFADASVLMNVKADEFVAIFGISEEGATVAECRAKVESEASRFTEDLKRVGVPASDVFTDFVAQNRVYGYDVTGDVATEKLTGYEFKKNVAVHYRNPTLFDQIVATAVSDQVLDLVKVDYIVRDIAAIRQRLMEEAAKVLQAKLSAYDALLGVKTRQATQVCIDKMSIYYPTEMYDSYTAAESEDVSAWVRSRYVVHGARKMKTFYYNALTAKSFDKVVNPVVTEPVVQFTLYLKLRYDTTKPKPARAAKS